MNMPEPNTLFLIARHGLKMGSERGLLESWMWDLTPDDESMSYLSLHKSKSDRAHKGGAIVGFREATEGEVLGHQALLAEIGQEAMQDTAARKIIIFRVDPNWKKPWSKESRSHQMAYKAVGHVEISA